MSKRLPLIALGVIAGVLSIVAFQLMPALGYFVVFQWLSQVISRDAGVQPFVGSAFAAIFSVFFVETAWKMFRGSADSRRMALRIFAGGLAVYFGLLSFATHLEFFHNGREVRWIEVQPDGTIQAVPREINRFTNKPNIRITEENVRLLDGKPASRVAVGESTAFFDSFGYPRLWYGRDLNDAIQFYDKPGRNPQTGELLQDPTKDIIMAALDSAKVVKAEAQILAESADAPHQIQVWPNMPLLRDDGTPLYWFAASQNRFTLYDRDGLDPLTHLRLRPLTKPLADDLDRWMREEMARRQNGLNDFDAYLRKYGGQRPYDAHR